MERQKHSEVERSGIENGIKEGDVVVVDDDDDDDDDLLILDDDDNNKRNKP